MLKIYFISSIVFMLVGCGTYSIREQADIDLEYNYYQDLLDARKNRSGDECVRKFRSQNVLNEYNLSNGNFVYAAPVMCGCVVHYEIDRKTKKIINYKLEGKNCSNNK